MESLDEDEMLMAKAFQESKLSHEDRAAFSEDKDAALMVWIQNAAWKAVPEDEACEGEVVRARFLQRWKPTADGHKPNARVILQGFRHKEVLHENLQRESPTLSHLGCITLMVWAVHRRWKIWCADVKRTFMQSDSIEILKATKPAFGDVRAPRE